MLLGWAAAGLDEIDLRLYDWSLRRLLAAVNRDIVLVEINDASIRDYAPAVGRWRARVLQSNLIDFLQRARASHCATFS
jgi:CHASE2 domain-containing sensor protein